MASGAGPQLRAAGGYAQFLSILDGTDRDRGATGLAQGCVDVSVEYAHEREAFGRPIGTNQSIQFMIADMQMRRTSLVVWRGQRAGWAW